MKAESIGSVPTQSRGSNLETIHPKAFRWFSLIGCFVLVMSMYLIWLTPVLENWGTTAYERQMVLPGDQYVANSKQETHAITINAPSSLVWKWVAQLGQDRGGFYSYDFLENLAGCQMPTKDYLRSDKQSWRAGDKLWMYPPSKGIPISGAPLVEYIPGHALGFTTTLNQPNDSLWSFNLQPIDGSHTRLLVRGKGPVEDSFGRMVFDRVIFDPAHFVMEKRMMIGIKQLSEGRDRGRATNNAQLCLWTLTFALWVASIVFVLRRDVWVYSLIGFVYASIIFQILTLGQPPVWLGAILVASIVWVLWPRPLMEKAVLAEAPKPAMNT